MLKSLIKDDVKLTAQTPKEVRFGVHPTPYGDLLIGLTEEGELCRLGIMGKQKLGAVMKEWRHAWPKTQFIEDKKATEKVARLIFGKAKGPLKICLIGTEFQQKVWKALMEIPEGTTVSYGDIARRIKNPKAVRAVGGAIGANPVPILIPCHRVIASSGKLGGYTGGVAIKKRLLDAENVAFS